MEEIGKVVSIDGQLARVEIEAKGACNRCSVRMICNPAGNKMYTEAINDGGAKIGDIVKLEMAPGSTILAALLLFIFPIIAFGVGFAVLRLIAKTEGIGILGGVVFLAIYFFFLKKLDERISKGRKFKPIVKEILKELQS